MRIAVIVPTRGRPDNAQRLVNVFRDTTGGLDETHLIFGLDDDDDALDGYDDVMHDERTTFITGPRLRMAGTLNAIAREVAYDYDIIGFMGDDHCPRTKRWDTRIADAMVPGGIVYGNDLIQGAALPTEVFLDAKIVQTLGGFVPDGFIHLFLDNTWKTWGEKTGKLIYLDDVIIEHLHPLVGKAESDAGYTDVNSHAVWTADEIRYNDYVSSGELDADVQKLKAIT